MSPESESIYDLWSFPSVRPGVLVARPSVVVAWPGEVVARPASARLSSPCLASVFLASPPCHMCSHCLTLPPTHAQLCNGLLCKKEMLSKTERRVWAFFFTWKNEWVKANVWQRMLRVFVCVFRRGAVHWSRPGYGSQSLNERVDSHMFKAVRLAEFLHKLTLQLEIKV